jgi:hypothetical protein
MVGHRPSTVRRRPNRVTTSGARAVWPDPEAWGYACLTMLKQIIAYLIVVGAGSAIACSSVGAPGEDDGRGGSGGAPSGAAGGSGGIAGGPSGVAGGPGGRGGAPVGGLGGLGGGAMVSCFGGAIACGDAFTATLTAPLADFPAGNYQIDVTADGTALTCTFDWPQPVAGPFQSGPCTLGLSASIRGSYCTSGGWSCEPFVETISLWSHPAEIRVQQAVDGVPMFDRTFSPVYRTDRPLDHVCGPGCWRSTPVELTLDP